MPVTLSASYQVERLREAADGENGHAVQIMPPPSYLHALLYEGNTVFEFSPDIILIYKLNTKTSTSSLPLDVRDVNDVSIDSALEGNPLPAPFDENDEFDVSVFEKNECQWPKEELNHLPLNASDALKIFGAADGFAYDVSNTFDIWCLLDEGLKKESLLKAQNKSHDDVQSISSLSISNVNLSTSSIGIEVNKKARVMVGLHSTGNWWSRSFVEYQGICSIESPEMDPLSMKKHHLELTDVPEFKMNAAVVCRYNMIGEHFDSYISPSGSSVSLELEWKQPTMSVPHQDTSARVVVQARVGDKLSHSNGLWTQLQFVNNLFDLLVVCWRDHTMPDSLPHLTQTIEDSTKEVPPLEPLGSRIQTLIAGGKQALQAQNAGRMSLAQSQVSRQSKAPSGFGRHSMAPGFLSRMSMAPQGIKEPSETEIKTFSLTECINIVTSGNRTNADITDGLFSLMAECKTYRELMSAWDDTFMELAEGHHPFIRSKNYTRAARIIQGYVEGQIETSPQFLVDGKLLVLELLIEMGLEKLTADYQYIFTESQLAGRDDLQAPQLMRFGLGVPREKWLASCGNLLGWLAQVHCSLEIILPLQDALSCSRVPFMVSQALKFYQSDRSPVRSVSGLSPSEKQEFSWFVNADGVLEHANNKQFDWWKMRLTSVSETRKVQSTFLRRRLHPIFPPQLCDNQCAGLEQYHCAEAVTISEKF